MEQIQESLDHLVSGPYPWFAAAIVLFLFILWIAARRQPASIVAFDSPNGEIRVARTAISELVQRTGNTMSTVGKCSTLVRTRGGSLHIEVRIKLLAGSKLNEVSSELQSRLSNTLRENLAIDKLAGIDVVVVGFTGKIESDYLPVSAPSSHLDDGDPDPPEEEK